MLSRTRDIFFFFPSFLGGIERENLGRLLRFVSGMGFLKSDRLRQSF